MRDQLRLLRRCAGLYDHEGRAPRLRPDVDGDNLRIGDALARLQFILDLAGADQEPAETHSVAGPRFVDERAVVAHAADVAGAKEAVRRRRFCGGLRILEIAEKARRRGDLDFAADAGAGDLVRLAVAHAHPR